MSITLNDREEETCRIALDMLLRNHKHGFTYNLVPPMSEVEIAELIETMGPNSGKAFAIGLEPDPLMEQS